MKSIKFLGWMFISLLASVSLTSCSDDDDEPEPQPVVESVDMASAIEGVYSGQRKVGTSVVDDAYIVRVVKLTSTTVRVEADFYGDDGGENFNVTKQGDQYVLINETSQGISITITGKTISINYLTNGGYMMSYVGIKG